MLPTRGERQRERAPVRMNTAKRQTDKTARRNRCTNLLHTSNGWPHKGKGCCHPCTYVRVGGVDNKNATHQPPSARAPRKVLAEKHERLALG